MGMIQDISFLFISLNGLCKSHHSGVRIRITLFLQQLFYWLVQGKVYFLIFNNLTCVLLEIISDFFWCTKIIILSLSIHFCVLINTPSNLFNFKDTETSDKHFQFHQPVYKKVNLDKYCCKKIKF